MIRKTPLAALLACAPLACSHASPTATASPSTSTNPSTNPSTSTSTAANLSPAAAAPPLYDDLGELHHAISTRSPEAQRYFDQGLRLLYAFNHEEAIRAFQQAAALDPSCAMCLWGVAVALGPNINMAADPDHEKLALEAVKAAQALGPAGAEAAYVAAVAKRYANPPGADRRALDAAYADAMRALARRYPDDADAATLFAEALMDLRPWDLWTHDGKPQPGTEEILATLEAVLRQAPQHPGANHFYIHATEGSPHPEKALEAARRLPALMPGAGHLVHMPSHTYARTGRYEEAAEANRRAIAADKRYLERSQARGMYATMYVAHNFQFLWASASMEGRSAEALQAARDLVARFPDELARSMEAQMPGFDYSLAPPLFTLVRFGRWSEVLAEPAPPADFKYLTAVWHFARGLALAATGRPAEARGEHAALAAFVRALPKDAMLGPLNAAQAVFAVADAQLAGEIAARSGDRAQALPLLEAAVRAEDALNYDEPRPWSQPARQSLGAVLLEAGDAKRAEVVFREDLARNPDNGWSLFGLAQALRRQRSAKAAAEAEQRFEKAWAKADVKLTAARF